MRTRPRPAAAARVNAERRGRRAEVLALWLLRAKGYRLIARRFRTPVGEIDLIMRRRRVVAFVEVKHRPGETEGLDAVTAGSRKRIARAADYWLAGHPDAVGLDLRFDIVVARPRRLPRHYPGVFDATGAAW
jgi:putative endonuclease